MLNDISYENLNPTQFDIEYDYNDQVIKPNQDSLCRHEDILKRKKNKSMYDDVIPSIYGSVVQLHTNNPDPGFMKAYDDLKWSEKYQICRVRRKRSM
jgi:hypothetical protein